MKFFKKSLIAAAIASVLCLTSCSTISKIADKASSINDEALISAEFTICNAASVGSIERRYNTKKLLQARKVICDHEKIVIIE